MVEAQQKFQDRMTALTSISHLPLRRLPSSRLWVPICSFRGPGKGGSGQKNNWRSYLMPNKVKCLLPTLDMKLNFPTCSWYKGMAVTESWVALPQRKLERQRGRWKAQHSALSTAQIQSVWNGEWHFRKLLVIIMLLLAVHPGNFPGHAAVSSDLLEGEVAAWHQDPVPPRDRPFTPWISAPQP